VPASTAIGVRIVTETRRLVGHRRVTVAERTATFDSTARATADMLRRVNGTPSKDAIDERTESAVTSVPSSPETITADEENAKTGEKNATHAPPPARASVTSVSAIRRATSIRRAR